MKRIKISSTDKRKILEAVERGLSDGRIKFDNNTVWITVEKHIHIFSFGKRKDRR